MPLIVPCQDLAPGMRLASAFIWKGRTMLPGGKVLTADDVEVVQRKYPQMVFKVGDPILDSLVEFEDDGRDREVAATARAKIVATVTDVHGRLASQSAHGGIDYNKARSVVADVMEFLATNPVSAALIDRNIDAGSPLAEHTGTAFYLSMVLGAAVRDYVFRERQRQTSAGRLSSDIGLNLLPLGLGAMFMDVGMQPLGHVFQDGYELTPADRKAILDHPRAGADLLPDTLPTGVKMVVRSHHENFDGTGYPNRSPGPSLHVFTRIVRIADAFAAATGSRAYRGCKSPSRTIWEMSIGPYRRCYDPVLVKVFASLIQPFPIGAKLKLADGRFGVVVRYNRKEPFKPNLVVAFDASGRRLPEADMKQLSADDQGPASPTRIIAYGEEDLTYIHDVPPPETVAQMIPPPAATRALQPQEWSLPTLASAAYP